MKISKKQVCMLQVARRTLGMEQDDYRAILDQEAGVDSTKDIEREDFQGVLRRFEALGFQRKDSNGRNRPRGKDHGWRMNRASPAQVRYIRDLWFEFTDGKGDDRTLGKWLERQFKVSDLRFVGDAQAAKVITALRSMVSNKRKDA